MSWTIIIVSGVLLWGIFKLVRAVCGLIVMIKEAPEAYELYKKLGDANSKIWESERKLSVLQREYEELEIRWRQVRKRKEELRHENRKLKKNNQP